MREYIEQHYLPAVAAYRERAADQGALSAQVVNWQRVVEQNWSNLRFGEMKVASGGGKHVFKVQVFLSGLDPNTVRVELYADGVNGGEAVREEMKRGPQLVGADGYIYRVQVPSIRPATDYTARLIPHCSGVAVPLEAARILWQR